MILRSITIGVLFVLLHVVCAAQVANRGRGGAGGHIPKKYAFIVGISNYRDSMYFPHLQYAKSDADRFYDFLLKGYMPGVGPGNIKRITGDSATWSNVDISLGHWLMNLEDSLGRGDCIYIYWSGHGALSKLDQSLACHDTRFSENDYNLDGKLSFDISLNRIKSSIAAVIEAEAGIKVFLIIDACRSKLNGVEVSGIAEQVSQTTLTDGDVYMYSATAGGPSFESGMLTPGSGLFTYFLILGLEGGADNSPRNNKVTISEMQQFLGNVTAYATNVLKKPPQTPCIVYRDTRVGSFVLTQVPPDVVKENRRTADAIKHLIDNSATVGDTDIDTDADETGIKGIRALSRHSTLDFVKPVAASRPYVIERDSPHIDLYDSLLANISRNQLVRPKGNSAYDYYLQLLDTDSNSKKADDAKTQLIIALQNKVKEFIERYLTGRLGNPAKDMFDLAHEELDLAFRLRPAGDPFAADLVPKLEFLQARALAGSNNPVDWNKGLELIDSALAESKTAYMYHTKGVLYQNKSRYFSAIRYFDSTLHYAPDWLYAQYSLATAYFMIQEYDKSISYCNKVLEKDSNYSRIYSWLGYNYETIADNQPDAGGIRSNAYRDYLKAIKYNQKALSKDTGNTYAWLNLGRIYLKLPGNRNGNLQQAKNFFSTGGFKLGDSRCLTWLGRVYESTGMVDSARFCYHHAVAMNPFDTAALDNYASFLYRQGRPREADSLYLAALDKTRGTDQQYDYKFYSKYCSFVFRTKSTAMADSIFANIIHVNNEDPYVYIGYSQQYEGIDSLLRARDILRSGLKNMDGSPSLNYAMAQLYFKNFRNPIFGEDALDSSQHYLNALRVVSPDYSLLNYALSQVHMAKDDSDSAKSFLVIANSSNKFINATNNFNQELIKSGDDELHRGKYSKATQYFKTAGHLSDYTKDASLNDYQIQISLSRNKFIAIYNTALSYYLNSQLDSAQFYCSMLDTFINAADAGEVTDSGYLEKQMSLSGLIEFDKRNVKGYRKAMSSFSELDNNFRLVPDFLEQAVCLYTLGYKKQAVSKATFDKSASLSAYQRMLELEGVSYSRYFISRLKSLIKEIGSSFFQGGSQPGEKN